MPYLIQNDFLKQIQAGNLQQVIGSNYSIINGWLLAAQEKAASYLAQKYFISAEFTETGIWSTANTYNAANRVYLDAPAYDPTATYAIGDYCTYLPSVPGPVTNFYIATAASTAIAFNPVNWSVPIPQYTLYYALYPNPAFDVYHNYNVGDMVFWKNNVYTALHPSAQINNAYVLQYGSIKNIPLRNYFPDAPNQTQWGTPTAYSVPANTTITDTTYWAQGDNRSQQMVQVCINLVLYYAHARISPMNIPALVKDNYNEAVNWLKDAGDGLITPNLLKLQPEKGDRIRFGGQIKHVNSY